MASTNPSVREAPLTAKRESAPRAAKPPSTRAPKDRTRLFIKPLLKSHRELERPPFDCIALVLQGGGALGAFQAGVYQALAEANLEPDWVAGISIGAINAALIAGNAPEVRLEKLRAFWEQVTTQLMFDPFGIAHYWLRGDLGHVFLNRLRAGHHPRGCSRVPQAANCSTLFFAAGNGRGDQLV
jgi:predicted acylesterase/phospholipase RssA